MIWPTGAPWFNVMLLYSNSDWNRVDLDHCCSMAQSDKFIQNSQTKRINLKFCACMTPSDDLTYDCLKNIYRFGALQLHSSKDELHKNYLRKHQRCSLPQSDDFMNETSSLYFIGGSAKIVKCINCLFGIHVSINKYFFVYLEKHRIDRTNVSRLWRQGWPGRLHSLKLFVLWVSCVCIARKQIIQLVNVCFACEQPNNVHVLQHI